MLWRRRLWLWRLSCWLTHWLSNVFLRHGFFEQLNRGCSALEDMFLYDAIIIDQEFSSQTLKALTIDYSRFSDEYQTSISIQSLVHLSMECPAGRVPSLQNMTSLVTASIRVLEENVVADTRQFLSGLSGVRNLDLNYPGKKLEMDRELQWCPKFSNLTDLTLGQWCLGAKFSTLTIFLQNSPMLEKLTLKLPEHGLSASAIIIGEPKERSFTCEHLQIVEVTCEEDNPLLNCVQDYLVAKGITSVQICIKCPSQIQREEPDFFRYEYR
ncbi:uncharacterized protein LOC133907285 [Phragmites australis]|uniref:uncharacterized protein LOC133907285 n=1 Tax=Phragmites australis TaxID=29695 RepID=UPI002D787C21|nr:uncharacterized protein LOC133907285 [Phragmites australis]